MRVLLKCFDWEYLSCQSGYKWSRVTDRQILVWYSSQWIVNFSKQSINCSREMQDNFVSILLINISTCSPKSLLVFTLFASTRRSADHYWSWSVQFSLLFTIWTSSERVYYIAGKTQPLKYDKQTLSRRWFVAICRVTLIGAGSNQLNINGPSVPVSGVTSC